MILELSTKYAMILRDLNKMKGKRGLLEDTTSIVISVLAILILIGVGVAIYRYAASGESETAKKSIDVVEARIQELRDGETGRFPMKGPTGWNLMGWSKNQEGRPDKCYFESCICICKKSNSESCQSSGFCRNVDKENVRIAGDIVIEERMVSESGRTIRTETEHNYITFPSNFLELRISKTKTEIIISKNG